MLTHIMLSLYSRSLDSIKTLGQDMYSFRSLYVYYTIYMYITLGFNSTPTYCYSKMSEVCFLCLKSLNNLSTQ